MIVFKSLGKYWLPATEDRWYPIELKNYVEDEEDTIINFG